MAKKKGARRAARYDDSDDEVSSTTSTTLSSDFGGQEADAVYDEDSAVEGYIDALYEKRATTREAGLRGLIGAFTTDVLSEFAESKFETLLQQYTISIRRGGAEECALAARALSLLVLTLGAGSSAESVAEEATPHLTRVTKAASSSAARIAAVEAMAVLAFIAAPDVQSTEHTMATLWAIGGHTGSQSDAQRLGAAAPAGAVRAAALRAWNLLLSTVPSAQLSTYHGPRDVAALSALLKDGDASVRGAAGESIALLLEAGGADFLQQQQQHSSYSNGNGGGDDAEDEDEDEDYEWGGPQNGHRNGNGDDDEGVGASAADELVEAVRGLAVQPGRRQSKKERSQRGTFRDIMVSIEKGVCPEATIKLKQGDSLHISTWSQTVQLNAMRHLLAEGFQRHMQDNELMHQIFEYQPQVAKSRGFRSPAEKRMFQSPNSIAAKARTQNRKSRRSQAEAGNMGHFSIDEHDI